MTTRRGFLRGTLLAALLGPAIAGQEWEVAEPEPEATASSELMACCAASWTMTVTVTHPDGSRETHGPFTMEQAEHPGQYAGVVNTA